MGINNFEKFPQTIVPRPGRKYEKKSRPANDELTEEGRDRRNLIKLGAAAAISGTALFKLADFLLTDPKNNNAVSKPQANRFPEAKGLAPEDPESNLEVKEAKKIMEILNFYTEGPIKFDKKTVEALTNYHTFEFSNQASYAKAYQKIGEWKPELESIFRKVFADMITDKESETKILNLIYLAIPESEWNFHKGSPAGAMGPYQFMPATAMEYGLRIDNVIDERRDPLKSGKAAAKFLKWLLSLSNNDLDLALKGYNGGFFGRHRKECKKDGKPFTDNGLLDYIQNKINLVRKPIMDRNSYYKYQVSKEDLTGHDPIQTISKKTGIKPNFLKKVNNLKKGFKLHAGQKLRIPTSNDWDEQKFINDIRFFKENLDYPPKYHAIIKLIETGRYSVQNPPIKYQEVKAEMITVVKEEKRKVIKKGFFRKKKEVIETVKVKKNISESLYDISKRTGVSPVRMRDINPAIINPNAPLPPGYMIRI